MLFEAIRSPKEASEPVPVVPEELPISSGSPSSALSSSAGGKRFSLLTKLLKENEMEASSTLSSVNVTASTSATTTSSSSSSKEPQTKKRSSTVDYSCNDLLHAIAKELSNRAEQLGISPPSPESLSLFGSEDDGRIMDDLPEFSLESVLLDSGLNRFAVCDKTSGVYLYNVIVDFAQHILCLREGMSLPIRVGGGAPQGLDSGASPPLFPSLSESPVKRSPLRKLKTSPREAIFVEVSARRIASPRGLWKVVDSVAMEERGKEDVLNKSISSSYDGSDNGGTFYCVGSSGEDLLSMGVRSDDSSDCSRDMSRDTFDLSVDGV